MLSAIINAKHETRIKTIDSNEIEKVKEDIKELQSNFKFPEKDIKQWGRQLYKEPIN